MADTSTLVKDPAERGNLTIADRVVEQVAVQAACEVDGVVVSGSGLDRAVGRKYPRVQAHVAGRRVRVVLQIAVLWPAALPQVTSAVRDTVRERIGSLVGLQVDAVDVSVAKVLHEKPRSVRGVS